MPRYVILEHDHPELHWDLMLEVGEMLRTWRLALLPQPGQIIRATATFDHRLIYLDYEGPISGGRGQVKRWDHGDLVWKAESEDRLALEFAGKQLRGRASLERIKEDEWKFVYWQE